VLEAQATFGPDIAEQISNAKRSRNAG